MRRATGFGRPHDELLIGIGRLDEGVPIEYEFADPGMDERRRAGTQTGDVACRPPLAELRILYR